MSKVDYCQYPRSTPLPLCIQVRSHPAKVTTIPTFIMITLDT